MDDHISRQGAIDALGDAHFKNYGTAILVIKDLPSAEPKKGKWIDFSDEGYVECPYCHSATNCDGNKEELHYCYSCGADMRESE